MFCAKCGTKMEDTDRVCPACGTPVGDPSRPAAPIAPPNMPMPAVPAVPRAPRAPSPFVTALKKHIKIIIPVAVAVIAAVVVLIVILSQPKVVDLSQMIDVEFSGYDSVGKASVRIDGDALEERLTEILGSGPNLRSAYYDCIDAVEVWLDKSTKLANGDEVKVTISYDNEAVKDLHIKFQGDSAAFTVEGLEPIKVIDPFAGLKVEFSGISPNGTMSYEYTGDTTYIGRYDFDCDMWRDLKNGDVVTFTVPGKSNTEERGYRLSSTSKTYTVEGLDEYVESYSDFTAEYLTGLKDDAVDAIRAYVAKSYSDSSALGDLEYVGYSFCSALDMSSYGDKNLLHIVYRGLVSNSKKDFPTTMIYFPVRYKNILLSGGELQAPQDSELVGKFSLGDGWYSTKGYGVPFQAYADLVTARMDQYRVEVGDGLEAYESYAPITRLADISEANLAEFQKEAKDAIVAYLADFKDITSTDPEYVGAYLLSAKSPSDYGKDAYLTLVFKASGTITLNKEPVTTEAYFPVRFAGVVNIPGNEIMYHVRSKVLGSAGFPKSSYSTTNGYVDGAAMYKDLVTSNRDKFNYQVSDGLKQFGE